MHWLSSGKQYSVERVPETSSKGLWPSQLLHSCIPSSFSDFMYLSRQFDFYGLTFYSYMIHIIFLDVFVKYSVIQFYLTITYCLRDANHPLDLRGFKNERDTVSIFRDPAADQRKSTITVIIILIITLIKHVLCARHCYNILLKLISSYV